MILSHRHLRLSPALAAALVPLALGCGPDDGPVDGECSSSILVGDLVITEIMANPLGEDRGNEWFEIYNASSTALDLTGLTLIYSLSDGTGEKTHKMRELVIEPGGYLVLGGVVPELAPSYVAYGFGNDLGPMRNGGARLAVSCAGTLIDEAEYPSVENTAFDGVALGLDGNAAPSHLANDTIDNFCPATGEFIDGQFGSPGDSNEPCNIVVPGMCSEGGSMRPVNSPAIGDLVISEFMANPDAVGDTAGEWFEVYVARDVDLNGVVAGLVPGEPKSSVASGDCVTASAGDYLLFARQADEAFNGGLPPVDQVFNFNLKNGTTSTGPGTLYVGIGDTVLDEISYESSSTGASTALDPRVLDRDANDDAANWCPAAPVYGDGDKGTPGAENEQCPIEPVECDPGQCFDGEACRDAVAPQAGDVLVTEVLANPNLAGTDTAHEWFELTIQGDFDLNGLELGRNETVEQTIAYGACIPVTAGDIVVFAGNLDMASNSGLPQADLRKTFTLNNDNTNRTVSVGFGGAFFHSLRYNGSLVGQSTQLDPDGVTVCPTPSATPYGDNGDLGTPGDANPACPD